MVKSNVNLSATMTFIDLDYVVYAHKNQFSRRPDWTEIFLHLKTLGQLVAVYAYGDCTRDKLIQQEVQNIRAFNTTIVETGNFTERQKNNTDPIMIQQIKFFLDITENTDQIEHVILFTGDNDFVPIASEIIFKYGKQLTICGVRGSISGQFHKISSLTNGIIEFPLRDPADLRDVVMKIIDNIREAVKQGKRPTYVKTIEIVSARYNQDEKVVEETLQELLEYGIVYKHVMPDNVRILHIDEDKLYQYRDVYGLPNDPLSKHSQNLQQLLVPSTNETCKSDEQNDPIHGRNVLIKAPPYRHQKGKITGTQDQDYLVEILSYGIVERLSRDQFALC